MAATVRQLVFTDEMLAAGGGASFASLEVPADYPATLSKVEDYDKRDQGKTHGWKLTFYVEGLPFDVFLALTDSAQWKVRDALDALDPGWRERRAADGTTAPIDFNAMLGRVVGAHVIQDEKANVPRKTIDYLFSLAEPEPDVEDVPAL